MENLKMWFVFRPWRRHSLVLMVGGLVHIFLGLSYVSVGDLDARRELSLAAALNLMPLQSWSLIFVMAGALACLSSRWPAFSDSWGYMVMCGLGSGWSAMYYVGWLFGPAPITNVAYGAVWSMVGFMWWAISGLVNPEKVLDVVVPDGSA